MAEAVLSTKLSRRTMLAGGVLAALPAADRIAAAAPARAAPLIAAGTGGPDAELLRRIAAAAGIWDDHTRAEVRCRWLHEAMRRHPDWPANPYSEAGSWAVEAIAQRIGYRAADNAALRLYDAHEAALAAAFSLPARSLPGLFAKLRAAAHMLRQRHGEGFDAVDLRWLDSTVADMDHIAAGGVYPSSTSSRL